MSKRVYIERRPHVPAVLRRQALVEAGHKCSIPTCSVNDALELHHINNNRNDNYIENVIMLCRNHHHNAGKGVFDRKSLQEYKRINRKRNTLESNFEFSSDMRESYLEQFKELVKNELLALESSPITQTQTGYHVTPSLDIGKSSADSETAFLENIDNVLEKHKKMMLVGNGGEGKTVALLTWLSHRCFQALENELVALPVYAPLRLLTANQSIHSLVRSSMGRFGIVIKQEQLEEALLSGQITLVFDGLNEMHKKAEEGGAVQDIINFVQTYPTVKIIISSRYTVMADSINMKRVHMIGWDQFKIHDYLVHRLGETLGTQLFTKLGDNVDFEWMQRCSVTGLCSSPLTLWMLATVAEKESGISDTNEDIVNRLVDILVKRTPDAIKGEIPSNIIVQLLEEFAYLMICEGYVVSIGKQEALGICTRIITEWTAKGLLPRWLDSYGLLSLLKATGLIFEKDEGIVEWLHQVLQEKLSVHASDRIFLNFCRLSDLLRCPKCGYLPDFYMKDNEVWGKCRDEKDEKCVPFKVPIPTVPSQYLLNDKIKVIDKTGAPVSEGKISYSQSVYDEGWFSVLMAGVVLYIILLGFTQDMGETRSLSRGDLYARFGELPPKLFDHYIWLLCEARIINVVQDLDLSVIHMYTPPANPSLRVEGFELEVQRDMNSYELEDEEDVERVIVVRKEEMDQIKGYSGQFPQRNRVFTIKEKARIFRVAQKYGGRIWRSWGPYREIIAEFPGEAWDISSASFDAKTPDIL